MSIIKQVPKQVTSLEDFILVGAVKETKEIMGTKVLMQTIPGEQLKNLLIDSTGLDIIARDKVTKIEILSRAIKSIGGISVLPDDESKKTRAEIIQEIRVKIGAWEQPVIDLFYEKYTELVTEQRDFIEQLKKK